MIRGCRKIQNGATATRVNRPGVKGKMLGEIKVKRKAFPDALFSR